MVENVRYRLFWHKHYEALKQNIFPDDESSSDEENDEPDEVIDLQDMDDNDIDNVAYDSEENEIDLKAEGVLLR